MFSSRTFCQTALSSSISKPLKQCVCRLSSSNSGFVLQVQAEVPAAAATATKQVHLMFCFKKKACCFLCRAELCCPFRLLLMTRLLRWEKRWGRLSPSHLNSSFTRGQRSKRYGVARACMYLCLCGREHGAACVTGFLHVSQCAITGQKGQKCGEREDSLPPGYRFENAVSLSHTLRFCCL